MPSADTVRSLSIRSCALCARNALTICGTRTALSAPPARIANITFGSLFATSKVTATLPTDPMAATSIMLRTSPPRRDAAVPAAMTIELRPRLRAGGADAAGPSSGPGAGSAAAVTVFSWVKRLLPGSGVCPAVSRPTGAAAETLLRPAPRGSTRARSRRGRRHRRGVRGGGLGGGLCRGGATERLLDVLAGGTVRRASAADRAPDAREEQERDEAGSNPRADLLPARPHAHLERRVVVDACTRRREHLGRDLDVARADRTDGHLHVELLACRDGLGGPLVDGEPRVVGAQHDGDRRVDVQPVAHPHRDVAGVGDEVDVLAGHHGEGSPHHGVRLVEHLAADLLAQAGVGAARDGERRDQPGHARLPDELVLVDRKSTRLNSS